MKNIYYPQTYHRRGNLNWISLIALSLILIAMGLLYMTSNSSPPSTWAAATRQAMWATGTAAATPSPFPTATATPEPTLTPTGTPTPLRTPNPLATDPVFNIPTQTTK